jgi:tetratricopeptide (TPR) repeat protein
MGGGAEQEHFVDGVTESLTTDLSRIRGSFVIGRNTAFTYKGKAVDLRQIGRELNVRYILEGSVQRGGNLLGLHERAVAWSRRAIEANRNYSMPYFNLGIALARLGRLDEARSAVMAGHELTPSFTISGYRASFTSITEDPTALAQMESLTDAQRMAGLPES